MSKLVCAAVVGALLLTAVAPTASTAAVVRPVPTGSTSGAAGVAGTGGFLGFVAALDLYDLIRRTTCSGDFLHLGGPGFSSPITPLMNVLPPQCVPVVKHRRHRKH
ncbi:MAG: hypothetical protein ACRECA_13995 [Pseudolabrys sp.]